MDIMQAKLDVIEAGKKLVEKGLIARTWGNVSCRISENEFVITPSGRSYESLTPDEIVLVKISDLTYEGDVKPSSEKGVHASAYMLRPDCNFVIHTHQLNASVVSVMSKDMPVENEEFSNVLGKVVPLAAYGMPSTKKLKKGVFTAIEQYPDSKAVIMSNHGAVCMGKDSEDAFFITQTLEDACEAYLAKKYSIYTAKKPVCYSSVREGTKFVIKGDDGSSADVAFVDSEIPAYAVTHKDIYVAREDINAIVQSATPDIMGAAAKCGKKLKPLLDDFAQIAGTTVKKITKDSKAVKALKGRNAVFMPDGTALCCGPDEDDAKAVEMVVDKNCKAYLAADAFDAVKYISGLDSVIMNFVYKMKYSKQKNK